MQEISELHGVARTFAQAGWPVFPCHANSKQPATTNGYLDATTDLAQIDAWWTLNPDYNPAFPPHAVGYGIVDVEAAGAEAWAELVREHAIPLTYTVRTPRGGWHYYFTGELPMTAWAPGRERCLGEHIDTRGKGSYALCPGAVVNGVAYTIEDAREPAPVPPWMGVKLAPREQAATAAVAQLDLPGNIMRARKLLEQYVASGFVAVEGQGGNNRTFQVACEVLNLGVSGYTAAGLLDDIWNPHCTPPWEGEELAVIIKNAERYAQNEAGAWAAGDTAEAFKDALPALLAADAVAQPKDKFHFRTEAEMEDAPEPTWLVPELIQDASTVLLYGPMGTFKSFLTTDIAMALSLGTVETFGHRPIRSGPVFYGALEGALGIMTGRRRAWKLVRGVDALPDFFVGPAPIVALPEEVQQFGDAIKKLCAGRRPALIVIDTVAQAMLGLNENDARDAMRFAKFCASLKEAFDCTVLAVHHTGKDAERGSRGHTSLPAGFDTLLELHGHPEKRLVEVRARKHKDAPLPEHGWHFKGRPVAGSLVFDRIGHEEYRQLTTGDDPLARGKVGRALAALGATTEATAVAGEALAGVLLGPEGQGEALAAKQARAKLARELARRAETTLAGYVIRGARGLSWALLAPAED